MANIAFWQGKCYSSLVFNYNFYLDMVALRQLKTGFFAAVSALSVSTAACAQEQTSPEAVTPVTQTEIANAEAIEQLICEISDQSFNPTVPARAARNEETGEWFEQSVVRTAAGRASRHGVVLALYGDDDALVRDVARAVHDGQACEDDLPVRVRGVVRGSPHDPPGVDVYSAGVRLATYTPELIQQARDSDLDLHASFLRMIEEGSNRHAEFRSWATGESADASGEQTGDARVVRTAANQPSGLD